METFKFALPYELPSFPFVVPPEIGAARAHRHRLVIVGAGLSGLTLACDLALRGVRAVVLDEDDTVGVRGASSRGICYAQKSLEIFERLGICQRIVDKGVTWSVGRTYSGDSEVYSFNLALDSVSAQPPFVNLQQFYVEWFLVDRITEIGCTDLRWKNRVSKVEPQGDHVRLTVQTPAGDYPLEADFVIDATGANSAIRGQLGLDAHASHSTDRWCISDVRFKKPLPTERWTWVDAPFNDGRAVWQHLMGDEVWRVDYQMADDADPETVSRPEVAGARLRRQLGPGVEFEFVWIGPYQYRDHLLDNFRAGRVFFIGDAAHVVSPFGARGGNSGVQDAANLGWKLAMVLQGRASEALLDSYNAERRPAAVENLQVTSRTARFIAPRSPAEHTLRRAAVALARRYPFARPLVNTGRMSVANAYPPGPCLPQGCRNVQNVPLLWADGTPTSVMQLLRGSSGQASDSNGNGNGQDTGHSDSDKAGNCSTCFLGLWFMPSSAAVDAAQSAMQVLLLSGRPLRLLAVGGATALPTLSDPDGGLARHLQATAGSLYLIRPDAYLAATLHNFEPSQLNAALRAALADPCNPSPVP